MIGTFGLNTCPDTTKCITSGLDFYIIDREHGRSSFTEAANLLASIDINCEKFIRVSHCQRTEIQKVLELSPDGILVPQISSYEDAEKVVDYSFFPPVGSRGLSPYTRAFGFNHSDLDNKKASINKNLKLGLLIEGKTGFKSLSKIINNLGSHINLIYFGLFDFANSQNIDPDWNNKVLADLLTKFIAEANKKNISVGTIARTKKDIKILEKMGVKYIVYLNDLGIFDKAVKGI